MSLRPDETDAGLDRIFSALADPTRRAILKRLMVEDATVGDLTGRFEMSQPAVSKHLKVLEAAGLIDRRREKQTRLAVLKAEPLAAAVAWLEVFREHWDGKLDRLDVLLEELKKESPDG